jgi:hypothetical protein
MRPHLSLVALCAGLAAGCAPQLAESVKPDEAGSALRTALDAWKAGKARADLEKQTPPILMNDLEWGPGTELVEFKMDEAGVMDGRQVRWQVRIKLKDKSGKVSEKKATYIIDTVPRIVIVRDTFAS